MSGFRLQEEKKVAVFLGLCIIRKYTLLNV